MEIAMDKGSRVFLTLMCCALCCLLARSAQADPVRITAGSVATAFGPLGQPLDAKQLDLVGAGFRLESPLEDEAAFVQLSTLSSLPADGLVDLSSVLHVGDIVAAQVNNSAALVAAFDGIFRASPTPFSCTTVGDFPECTAVAPFTFDARLVVTSSGVTATDDFVGSGTVEARVDRLGSFDNAALTYRFTSSVTPEPGTWALFLTGLIGLGRSARRSRTGWYRRA
jgi:hypothetical protein